MASSPSYGAAQWLRTLAAPAEGVVVVVGLVQGDTRSALVAGAAMGAMLVGPRAMGLAVVAAGGLGAWPAAAVAAIALASHGGTTVLARARAYQVDVDALAERVAALPPVLRPGGVDGAVSTTSLLDAARRARPDWWSAVAPSRRRDAGRSPAPSGTDGPLLVPEPPTGPCTQYAAEAIAIAFVVGEELGVAVDVHLLGAAAVFVPASAAAAQVELDHPLVAIEKLTGAHALQVTEAVARFARRSGGGDVLRRLDVDQAALMGGTSPLAAISVVLSQAVHARWLRSRTSLPPSDRRLRNG
jgi:hypothetical protein